MLPAHAETPRINLQNTEIRALVETVSRLTGKNFVIDPAVRGNITFVSGKGLSEEELYEAFLSILQVHGLEAIEAGNIIKIIPIGKARATVAPIVEVKPDIPSPKVDVDATITQVFKLQYIPVATAVQTLTPLAGQGETRIQFNQSSNSVIVTGRGQNVERLASVIKSIDQPNNNDFELVALKHTVASQLVQTLREVMSNGVSAEGAPLPQQVRISADERTNSILVAGDKADRERVRKVIDRLDTPRTQPGDTQVVQLQHAVASQLLQTLRDLQLTPNAVPAGADGAAAAAGANAVPLSKQVRIAADDRTNSILLAGPKAERDHIVAAITKLDVPRTQPGETQVVPLKYAVASKLIQTLRELQVTTAVAAGDGAAAGAVPVTKQVRIAADERTNSILLSGSKTERDPIVAAIRQLDIPKASSGGTKVVQLRYAKAEDMVKVLTEASKGILQQTAGTAAAATPGAAPAAAAAVSGGGSAVDADVSILADKTTNSIILSGPAYAQRDLLKVVYQLDRRRAQVLVEAIIAEVSTDLSNRLGFGVGAMDAAEGKTGLVGSSNFGGLNTALNIANGVSSLPNGLLMGIANTNFAFVVDALKGDGATNILSTPTIVTMDNEEAKMVVGQNVPFVTGSTTSSASGSSTTNPFTTIERKDVGLTLKVTPQINRGKTIQMKIAQEASSIAASSSGASDLITNKRSIDTNVMVEDGQVLVLGGLIQDNFNSTENKVPILSDLPVIGGAFKQNSAQKNKQNLMVFIHPVILPDREAADAYTRSKYHTLQKQQQQSRVLQRGNVAGAAAVFPDIECIDGACNKGGSADDLHFPAQPQRQVSQPRPQQRPQPKTSSNSTVGDCVPGFCQLEER